MRSFYRAVLPSDYIPSSSDTANNTLYQNVRTAVLNSKQTTYFKHEFMIEQARIVNRGIVAYLGMDVNTNLNSVASFAEKVGSGATYPSARFSNDWYERISIPALL